MIPFYGLFRRGPRKIRVPSAKKRDKDDHARLALVEKERIEDYHKEIELFGADDFTVDEVRLLLRFLEIFHVNEGKTVGQIEKEFIEWCFNYRCIAPELHKRLESMKNSKALAEGNMRFMAYLIGSVSDALRSKQPLFKDEIRNKLMSWTDEYGHHAQMMPLFAASFMARITFSGECLKDLQKRSKELAKEVGYREYKTTLEAQKRKLE